MQRSLEQHYTIKFYTKLGKSGSEALQLLRTAYGDAVLSSSRVLRWHKAFKDGRESTEDKQRTGHPSTSRTENNVAHVKAVLTFECTIYIYDMFNCNWVVTRWQ